MKGARRAGVIALVLLSPLAGCLEPPPPQSLHVTGVHHRWNPDGSVTITASLINIGTVTLPGNGGILTVEAQLLLEWQDFPHGLEQPPEGGTALNRSTFEDDGDWPPGRHETIQATVFPEAPGGGYFIIRVIASSNPPGEIESLMYVSECFTREGVERRGSCAPRYDRNGLRLPVDDPFWAGRMTKCCGWLPPSLDVVSLACARGTQDAECGVSLYNWRDEPREPVLRFRVLQAAPAGGEQVVREGTVETHGATIGPRGMQSFSFRLGGLDGLPDSPGLRREVELEAATTAKQEGAVLTRVPVRSIDAETPS